MENKEFEEWEKQIEEAVADQSKPSSDLDIALKEFKDHIKKCREDEERDGLIRLTTLGRARRKKGTDYGDLEVVIS